MKVLVVEDEKGISDAIASYLNSQKYVFDVAFTYLEASLKVNDNDYDCVVLDVGLPDGNGLDLISEIKERNKTTGIIIASAKGAVEDRIKGLELGADDYVTKPFHLSELSARLFAVHRRRYLNAENVLKSNKIEIDIVAHSVLVAGHEVELTNKEYELLVFFVGNRNRVLTKQSLSEHLWGDEVNFAHNYDFLYAQVKNLRKKLEKNGAGKVIHTAYGLGYKFIEDEITE